MKISSRGKWNRKELDFKKKNTKKPILLKLTGSFAHTILT
jgi:hypothetical protein